jgi:hypothetical protein
LSLRGDGRIGFGAVDVPWLVALTPLSTRHDLAVRAT